jgi:uncharacterized protein YndB with AHSA1/START domain
MKNSLFMDFSVNRENSTVTVKREFDAPVSKVWAAWTQKDLLDKWWAPQPWRSRTSSMDFREGGRRLYAMVGPKGEEHWALADFRSITKEKNFKFTDAFCDKDGNINKEFPQSSWSVDFEDMSGSTMVTVNIKHEKLSDLEKTIEMGFREGFTIAMEGLDKMLAE